MRMTEAMTKMVTLIAAPQNVRNVIHFSLATTDEGKTGKANVTTLNMAMR